MSTLFNYWHFVVLAIILLIYVSGVIGAIKQPIKKLQKPMIFSLTLIMLLITAFSIVVVDKYTKEVKLYKFKNKRLLSVEKIVYSGIVKNEGNHEIGEVTFEIKIVNKARSIGPSASFFTPSGFKDFFGGGANILYKPQSITKEFIVAKNLKPGKAKSFRIYFDYPPHFRNVSQFPKVYGH